MSKSTIMQHEVLLALEQLGKKFPKGETKLHSYQIRELSDGSRNFETDADFLLSPNIIFETILKIVKDLDEQARNLDDYELDSSKSQELTHQIEQHRSALLEFIDIVSHYLDEYPETETSTPINRIKQTLRTALLGGEIALGEVRLSRVSEGRRKKFY